MNTLIVSTTRLPDCRQDFNRQGYMGFEPHGENFSYDVPLIRSLFRDTPEWRIYQDGHCRELGTSPLWTRLKDNSAGVLMFPNNTKGLPFIYNRVLRRVIEKSQVECLIFVHDDVQIQHLQMIQEIENRFLGDYAVVGLAGAAKVNIKAPALWHLMSEQKDWSGAVSHPIDRVTYMMSSFGPTPRRSLVLDGLFLALNIKKFRENPVYFDEQFKFHHYDLDFCLSVNEAQMKMTTAPIWCTHRSPGLNSLEDPTFQASQKLFLSKWTK